MEKICKYCNEIIEYKLPQELTSHVSNCSKHPRRDEIDELRKLNGEKVKLKHDSIYKEKIKSWLNGENNGMRGKTSTAYWIKKYLIEIRGEKCEKCNWSEVNIYTSKIPIELSHIDGDFTNNRIENLELLCPNCHSLTDSHKGANKKKGRPRSKYYRGL